MIRVLFFGRYDPAYARNRVILKGLRAQDQVDIIECRVNPRERWWPFQLLWQYIHAPSFDIMYVAFPGHEVMLFAWFLTWKPIVFDVFTSHYEGYVLDRQKVLQNSLRARWYRFLDWWSCRLADTVLLDTQAHIDFFVREYGLDPARFRRVFVGTDPEVMCAAGPEPVGDFSVHFHGTVIPLQGIPYILEAAEQLKNDGIVFNLIGVNCPRVSYEQLAGAMARAHVCLGIFGDTEKTQRVIPNKVFEALAVGRPVITADTPAIREFLDDGSAILVPTANSQALADAIVQLYSEGEFRRSLARAGHEAFMAQATPEKIGKVVSNILEELI
jgi:glycosyltransferase involved in cell wall biosynthesis